MVWWRKYYIVLTRSYTTLICMKKVRNFPLLNESTPLRKNNPTHCWSVSCELITLIAISLKLMKKYISRVCYSAFEYRNSIFFIYDTREYMHIFRFSIRKMYILCKDTKTRRTTTKHEDIVKFIINSDAHT